MGEGDKVSSLGLMPEQVQVDDDEEEE